MKIVLDTNVFVAAFATHGLCEVIMELGRIMKTKIVSPGPFARILSEHKK